MEEDEKKVEEEERARGSSGPRICRALTPRSIDPPIPQVMGEGELGPNILGSPWAGVFGGDVWILQESKAEP